MYRDFTTEESWMAKKHLNVQSFSSSEKCKSKHWNIIPHQSEWVRSKTQVTAHAGEDVENEKHSSFAAGSASWYNHSVTQSGDSSENWK